MTLSQLYFLTYGFPIHSILSYQYPGGSGKFFINTNGDCITQPRSDIRITYTFDSTTNFLGNFVITDVQGNKFEFNAIEYSNSEDLGNSEFINIYSTYSAASFFLSRIITKNGRVIEFSYENNSITYIEEYYVYQSHDPVACNDRFSQLTGNQIRITQANKILKSIIWDEGRIEFRADSIRKDLLKIAIESPALNEIKIYNKDSLLVKHVEFVHDYFNNFNRLKLSGLKFRDAENGAVRQEYNYTYYDESHVPSLVRGNKSQDLWGYYNGAQNQILPKVDLLQKYYQRPQSTGYASPDRKSKDHGRAGLLKEIIYPAGGKTLFEYEPNKVMYERLNDIPLAMRDILDEESLIPIIDTTADSNSAMAGGNYVSHNINFSFTLTDTTRVQITAIYYNEDLTHFGQSEGWIDNLPCSASETGCTTTNVSQYGRTVTATYTLLPGTYSGYLATSAVDHNWAYAILRVSKYPSFKNTVLNVGGFRIAKALDSDNFGNVHTKTYTYPLDTLDRSNNSILRISPDLVVTLNRAEQVQIGEYSFACYPCGPSYNVNSFDIKNFEGFHIEYPKVVEYVGNNDSVGRVEHYFLKSQRVGGGSFPYATPMHYTWLEGVEYNTLTFDGPGKTDTARLILRNAKGFAIENNYSDTNALSIKLGLSEINPCLGYPGIVPATENEAVNALTFFDVDFIPAATQKFNDAGSTTEERRYYANGTFSTVATSHSFYYNNTSQSLPSSVVTVTSNGDTIRKFIKYPFDYSPANATIDTLLKRNIIAVPIEQYRTIKSPGGSEKVMESNFTYYADGNHLPQKAYSLELDEPVNLGSFSIATINGSGNFVKDGKYREKLHYSGYDEFGNLTDLIKNASESYSMIWGYNDLYPIASVTNAAAKDIFHTSFEEGDGNSADGDAKTGRKSKTNGFIKSLTGLTPGAYTLSYWQKSGPDWNYHESTVPVSGSGYTINLDDQVDEVRFYPQKARMTTYTYDPLIGMTSQCDVNNRVAYYEYDDFGRLSFIRDHDRNVVKRICYNYAGQPVACPGELYLNVEKSGVFTRSNCPTGATGGSATYTVAAGTYSSLLSQADADQQAQNDVNANGQAYANANGTCTFYNVLKSGVFTRNNCPTGHIPGSVTYTVAANTYSSLISQADADQQAQNDINANGQAYANANGTCTNYQACTFTVSYGFTTPYSSISKTGSTVSFNIIFYSTSQTMYSNSVYTIGQISSGCRPSQIKNFSFSANGRNFQASILPDGFVTAWIQSGGDLPPSQAVYFVGSF